MTWDDFEAEVRAASTKRGAGCSVGFILAGLRPELRRVVNAALANPAYTSSAIADVLRRKLPDTDMPQDGTFRRHRQGKCGCTKESS